MTPEEMLRKMQEIAREGGVEDSHREADALLCDVLRSLGYGEAVKAFEDMCKWYS